MALEQVDAGGNIWRSDKHYTIREMTTRKVRKFNTSATDDHLSLEPQMSGATLMDELGEIFDSMVGEMTKGMQDNDLIPSGTLLVRDVNGKASWPESCIRRLAFQKVSVGCLK